MTLNKTETHLSGENTLLNTKYTVSILCIGVMYFLCSCFGLFRRVPVQQQRYRWDVQEAVRGSEPHQLPVGAGLWQLC